MQLCDISSGQYLFHICLDRAKQDQKMYVARVPCSSCGKIRPVRAGTLFVFNTNESRSVNLPQLCRAVARLPDGSTVQVSSAATTLRAEVLTASGSTSHIAFEDSRSRGACEDAFASFKHYCRTCESTTETSYNRTACELGVCTINLLL